MVNILTMGDDRRTTPSRIALLTEFNCSECGANNPLYDAAAAGDQVICNYCGADFRVEPLDTGAFRLRPT